MSDLTYLEEWLHSMVNCQQFTITALILIQLISVSTTVVLVSLGKEFLMT